jgi:phosphatidylglycerophosphate synthase
MRKIPCELENFIDNILISIVDTIQPVFYKLGFTPNILTTISLICWLFALYFFVNDGIYYTFYTVLLIILSYFFDCFDGHFARSYNMVTKFGDYYDHISDIFKSILFVYFICTVYTSKAYYVLPILFIFLILSFMHLACQELYYNNTSDTLSFLKYLCIANKKNVNSVLGITRCFGCGTLHLVIVLTVIYLKNSGKIKIFS